LPFGLLESVICLVVILIKILRSDFGRHLLGGALLDIFDLDQDL
jgi:hypothetical protein